MRGITTLCAPTIRKLVNAGTVTPSLFDERGLADVTSDEFPGERLVVCRNPLLADERQRKRLELLAATEKLLEPIAAATRRESKPLRGAADIGIRVGKVLGRTLNAAGGSAGEATWYALRFAFEGGGPCHDPPRRNPHHE